MARLTTRLRAAFDVFRHGYPARRPMQRKAAPYAWPSFRQGVPQWQIVDLASFIDEGFNLNTLIYGAIMYKVRAGTTAMIRAYTGDEDAPEPAPPTHPLSRLLSRPNAHQSWIEFQGANIVYLNLAGNSYVYIDRKGKAPAAMYPLRPDRVFIVPGTGKFGEGAIAGYVYVPEGQTAWANWDAAQRADAVRTGQAVAILPDDMMHVKLPNPGDPLEGMGYGLSPLMPLARSADVDNKITEFLKLFFDGGTMVSGLLKFDVPLDDGTIAAIRERWKERYGGYLNWDEIGVLDQGGEYQRLGMTFEEMGFETLDERNESRILGPFGVPPILIGSRLGLMRSTYCLPADARITTLQGPCRIVDLQPGEKVWSFVDGRLEPRRVLRMWKTGRKRLYEIRTKNRVLRATGNHPILTRVPGKKGGVPNAERSAGYAWKRVDELTVGDSIVQVKSLPNCGEVFVSLDKQGLRLMQFLGAIIGDGTVTEGWGIRMAMPQSDRAAVAYEEMARECFTKDNGGPVTIRYRPRSFEFNCAKETRRLADMGFNGRALTKRIPGWVFATSRADRLHFIAGLIDTDGSIDRRGVLGYTSASKDLALDVRDLLVSVGIQCSNVYHHVYGPECLPQPGIRDEYHNYSITASSARQLADVPFIDDLYRRRVNANADRFKADGKDARQAGLSDDLGFYKIRSITALDVEDVYDIEVEGGHSFIADGVVVHNSNYKEARLAFWEDTMQPELRLFEVEYQYYLQTRDNVWPAFDLSSVPALRKDVPQLVTAWAQLVQLGVPKSVAAATVGLDLGQLPDGDVVYMPMNLVPIGAQAPAVQSEEGVGTTAVEETRKALPPHYSVAKEWTPEQKAEHWKAVDSVARSWEARFGDAARDVFDRERRDLLAMVAEAGKAARRRKATVGWMNTLLRVLDYMTMAGEAWREAFAPLLQGVMTAQGVRWQKELAGWIAQVGIQFAVRNLFAEEWFEQYTLKFAQPINKATTDALGTMFQQAEAEGWSVPQMEERLGLMFRQWMDGGLSAEEFAWFAERMPDYRRERIARTETIRASNAGSQELFSRWGVKEKEWIATRDDRVRDDHLAADGQRVAIGDAFDVGGYKAQFPGDPNLPPEQSINCRCSELPVV